MKENLDTSIEEVLKHEGGYVNHPEDPGGATNQGITKKTYERFLERPVSIEEIQNIPIQHVKEIYEKNYWNAVKANDLPSGVDFSVFDWAVKRGPPTRHTRFTKSGRFYGRRSYRSKYFKSGSKCRSD